MSKALAKKQKTQKMTFGMCMGTKAYQDMVASAIADPQRRAQFFPAVMHAVSANSDLQLCDPKSVLSAALLGEGLKLTPSPQLGQYYIVPYKSKKNDYGKVAQFVLGYKGYLQLAIRSGYYTKINVMPIKEGELIRWDPLNEVIEIELIEDDDDREAAQTIGYYAMFEYQNGFRKAISGASLRCWVTPTSSVQASRRQALSCSKKARYLKISCGDTRVFGIRTLTLWRVKRCCGSLCQSGV